MKIFSQLYDKMLSWSRHKYAVYYLALVAFTEALIFPIPPDVMLISMGLVKPERIWFYAGLVMVCSITGGILGYFIGHFCLDLVYPYIQSWGYENVYFTVHNWFKNWGPWAIIAASFMPIPFKILAISAGGVSMPFYAFVFAACVGRGSRFFIVSGLLFKYGERVSIVLRQYADRLGYATFGGGILAYLIYTFI